MLYMVDLALQTNMSDRRRRPRQMHQALALGARPSEVTNTRSDLRVCAVAALERPGALSGLTGQLVCPAASLRATRLLGCRSETSHVARVKLDYVGQPATPPVSGSHYEIGMPDSAGTDVQKPQLPRTASVHN